MRRTHRGLKHKRRTVLKIPKSTWHLLSRPVLPGLEDSRGEHVLGHGLLVPPPVPSCRVSNVSLSPPALTLLLLFHCHVLSFMSHLVPPFAFCLFFHILSCLYRFHLIPCCPHHHIFAYFITSSRLYCPVSPVFFLPCRLCVFDLILSLTGAPLILFFCRQNSARPSFSQFIWHLVSCSLS